MFGGTAAQWNGNGLAWRCNVILRQTSGWMVAVMVVLVAGGVRAAGPGTMPGPGAAGLEEAQRLLGELGTKKEFTEKDRIESLPGLCAVLRYRTHPEEALAAARGLSEPFYASLALGSMAARQIKSDPNGAEKLLREALERASTIKHYTGTDASSLGYLYALIPLLRADQAKGLLAVAREQLKAEEGDPMVKEHALLVLSRIAVAMDPALVAGLLEEAKGNPQSGHYYKAIQVLQRYQAGQEKQRTAAEAAAFYKSGKDWPDTEDPLVAAVLVDALGDLPGALARIKGLKEQTRAQAWYYVASALAEEGRTKEALGLLEQIAGLAKATGDKSFLPWAEATLRAKLVPFQAPPNTAADVDAFLAKPSAELLREMAGGMNRATTFRDAKQARDFVAAALPLAPEVLPLEGGDGLYWGLEKAAVLGLLARVAAQLGDAEGSLKIAGQIEIPELRVMYLLEAEEDMHPLPEVVGGWPIHYMALGMIRIGK